MMWNWQDENWPQFQYNQGLLEKEEARFLSESGFLLGVYQHVRAKDQNLLTIDLISDEALKTSEIEGEYLNRESLRSSIRKHFGLSTDHRKIPAREAAIAEMMLDLYQYFRAPLTHETLFHWSNLLTQTDYYRAHAEPMQIISGPIGRPKIHYEAPPSKDIPAEMDRFITWFNKSEQSLPALTRASIAHLYFELIHPFEDGNGRIGRALAQKALSQSIGRPLLIGLSHIIQNHKKDYYHQLEMSNRSLDIDAWLAYFAKTILSAQAYTQKQIDFLIHKTQFYDHFQNQFNERQSKTIERLFREGPAGFKGGLSAENYIRITGTSRATATRDLQDLVSKQALTQTGQLKSTRYQLKLPLLQANSHF